MTRLHTDESRNHGDGAGMVASHETVTRGSGEYVRGDAHKNSAGGFISVFRRGTKGVYQHCQEKHLHRHLAEFDFRYNHRVALGYNDAERAAAMVKGAAGKRLTYQGPNGA